LSIKLAY